MTITFQIFIIDVVRVIYTEGWMAEFEKSLPEGVCLKGWSAVDIGLTGDGGGEGDRERELVMVLVIRGGVEIVESISTSEVEVLCWSVGVIGSWKVTDFV